MSENRLRAAMALAGIGMYDLCAKSGISYSAMWRKLHGESEFTLGEMKKIQEALGITRDEMISIFFADDVQ